LVSVATIAVLGINIFGFANDSETNFSQGLTVNGGQDYPTTSELEEMVQEADVVLIGEYKDLDHTWNMARDPDDFQKEDTENYVEGHIYNFKVDEILKGESVLESLQVNLSILKL
jgi:hypothetical protein